eukprot:1160828-Pelagomonas_calceolata.AAC.4
MYTARAASVRLLAKQGRRTPTCVPAVIYVHSKGCVSETVGQAGKEDTHMCACSYVHSKGCVSETVGRAGKEATHMCACSYVQQLLPVSCWLRVSEHIAARFGDKARSWQASTRACLLLAVPREFGPKVPTILNDGGGVKGMP